MDAFCLQFTMVTRSLTFRRKIWCCWRCRGNTKRLNLRQFKLLCLSPLNRLQFHRRNSQTMATRQTAVYTNIFLWAVHLFTRLTFLENCVPFFYCALCALPWMSSVNIPLKAACHVKLWEIQQFGETKGCIVASWVLNCFHGRTEVAGSAWQN